MVQAGVTSFQVFGGVVYENQDTAASNDARQAIIKLLEDKYNSTFDEQLGQFKPEQEI